MQYPPIAHILLLLITSKEEEQAANAADILGNATKLYLDKNDLQAQMIGPAPAAISKANDIYRRVIYVKHKDYTTLIDIKNYIEGYYSYSQQFNGCNLQFDFDPMISY